MVNFVKDKIPRKVLTTKRVAKRKEPKFRFNDDVGWFGMRN